MTMWRKLETTILSSPNVWIENLAH